MNAKEAREIIKYHNKNHPQKDVDLCPSQRCNQAQGYLEALQGEEVKVLVEFAKKHHEVCEDCEGTGKIYKHADPTTGQWIPCPIAELLNLDGVKR